MCVCVLHEIGPEEKVVGVKGITEEVAHISKGSMY